MNVGKLLSIVLADADTRERNAGLSGRYDDDGAGALRREVEAYQCGMAREVPSTWKHYAEQLLREDDPEYAEFKRLAAKFGRV